MNVLVTGATGFLGHYLIEELLIRGYQVRCLVLPSDPFNQLDALPVDIVYGDVCQVETLYNAVKRVDYIFHLAGVKGTFDDTAYHRVNIQGTKNLVRAILRSGCDIKRFVFPSSQAAAGPSSDSHPVSENDLCSPLDLYGKSKLLVEQYLFKNQQNLPITILRLSPAYGPGDFAPSMIGIAIALTKHGIMPILRPHDRCLHIIHARDAVKGLILAAENEHAVGQIYFITSQEPYTWRKVAEHCFQIRGKKGWMIPLHDNIVRFGIKITKGYRKLRGLPVAGLDEMADYVFYRYWLCSGRKAKQELGFEPKILLVEGLEETIRWYDDFRL